MFRKLHFSKSVCLPGHLSIHAYLPVFQFVSYTDKNYSFPFCLIKAWHLAFSHDGTKLASCGRHCEVVVWDVKSCTKESNGAFLLWQLDGKELEERPLADTQYVEFSPNDAFLLFSATAKHTVFLNGEVVVCNARDGTILLHASRLSPRFWSTWVDNSWFVVGYSTAGTGGMFSIDLINVECGSQSMVHNPPRNVRNSTIFSTRINVVCTELSWNGLQAVQHCIVSRVSAKRGWCTFICQVKKGGKKHLAASSFTVDCAGSTDRDIPVHQDFNKIVEIDGHTSGMALTPAEDRLITAVCPGRHNAYGNPPTHVEVRIYDVPGLTLQHRLPSEHMACPLTYFYCHPCATEDVIAW